MLVTMKDIAEKAGVSVRTVSRALKQNGYVASDKAEIIQNLAKKMNYVPDDMARGIKTGKAKVIGFASGSACSEHTAKIIDGLSRRVDKHGYMLKVINGRHLSRGKEKYKQVVDTCIKNRLSALVLHVLSSSEIMEKIKNRLDEHNIELALVSNIVDNNCIHVTSCDTGGIKQAVAYLHKLGHRDFLFVSLGLVHSASIIRRNAYINALKNLGISNAKTISGDFIKIQNLLDNIFSKKCNRPTAITCSGDNIAIFAKDYLAKKYNLRTPEDVSIVGYGNFSSGTICYPPITTVYEPFRKMGERIVEKVIAKLEGRNFGELEEFIDTKLIVRGSTAPPKNKNK